MFLLVHGSGALAWAYLLATDLEAQPLVEDPRFSWKKEHCGHFFYRHCSRTGAALVITGVGPTAAAAVTSLACQVLDQPFLNLGVVGSLWEGHALGDCLWVGAVISGYERHPFDRRRDELELVGSSSVKLVTCAEAVHGGERRRDLAKRAALVDMELYAMAWACEAAKRSLRSYKVVSDGAQTEDAKLIVERIPELMTKIWASPSLVEIVAVDH
jgi:nucleoside phosphorylase